MSRWLRGFGDAWADFQGQAVTARRTDLHIDLELHEPALTGGGAFTGGGFLPAIRYPVNVFGVITVPQAETFNQARYTVKVDQKMGTNDQLSGTYLYDNGDDVTQWNGGDTTFGPDLPTMRVP